MVFEIKDKTNNLSASIKTFFRDWTCSVLYRLAVMGYNIFAMLSRRMGEQKQRSVAESANGLQI